MLIQRLKKLLQPYYTFNPLQWYRSTRRLESMSAAWLAEPRPPSGEGTRPFAVLVTPWLATVVPWYSIVVGLLLAARGVRVVFIFDDLPFGNYPFRSFFIRACIRRVLKRVATQHEVLVLSAFIKGPASEHDSGALIEQMATLNAVHALRGEMMASGRAQYEALVRRQLRKADPAIQRLLQVHRLDAIFIPGGIYGTTGLWLAHASRAGARVASYDAGGYGTVLLAADGIAAQLQDIPRAFAQIKAAIGSEHERQLILRVAGVELEKRHQGKDAFNSQLVATSTGPLDKYRGAILMALNSSWDQAALGLHTVFGTNANWIRETVQWVLAHTESTIVIRQHPSERLAVASTTDDYGAFLQQHFGSHPRLLFISAAEPVNTYELLTVVDTVVAYTSTIGVEAAALGKRVIVPSRSYYAQLGFVWGTGGRADYFDLISRSQAGTLTLTDAMRQDAVICYYATQTCNWVFSPFSPESYSLWSTNSVAQLNADPTVSVLLDALKDNVPAAVLNHRAQLARVPAVEGLV